MVAVGLMPLQVFVGTRIAEIQELTGSATWRYVPSRDNPADDLTRGLAVQELGGDSRWTQGPAFMKLPLTGWPKQSSLSCNESESEAKQPAVTVLTISSPSLSDIQQHLTLQDYLEATARQLKGATDPAAPLTADYITFTHLVDAFIQSDFQERAVN